MHGIINYAVAIYFLDPALANAFVARWCMGCMVGAPTGIDTPRGILCFDRLRQHLTDVLCAALLNAQQMGFYAPAPIGPDAQERPDRPARWRVIHF
jgi:hypothetical protein